MYIYMDMEMDMDMVCVVHLVDAAGALAILLCVLLARHVCVLS